jgi:type VI secretion system protein ImpL
MKTLIEFLKKPLVIQCIGMVALGLLVWLAGPLVAIAGYIPFDSPFNRLLAILVIVIGFTISIVVQQVLAIKKDKLLIAELAAPPENQAQETLAEAQGEERAALQQKFEQSLRLLKETRAKGKRDNQYLYELPWYIIIGAPGSGKTTLLLNSGLKFPLAERMGMGPVAGVGGTRNCDWLFAEDAVFLDTAGRYTTQDSHRNVDEAGWKGFLDLVKKYRARRPINGVLVTMSLNDLVTWKEEDLLHYAQVIRQRILELYTLLGIQFPIYMLFTKCDLLAGFTDFFADLKEEQRQDVWGETFQEAKAERTDAHISQFETNFNELLKRLQARILRRVQEETDLSRRGQILNFPRQLALLRPGIIKFLRHTFGRSGYEAEPLLRGVYFTSGTQEGTPIDCVMGLLAASYGIDRQSAPLFSGKGKSFFLTRLLKEVVFPEAELAGFDPLVERKRRFRQLAIVGGATGFAVIMLALWTLSFGLNKSAITKFAKEISNFQESGPSTGAATGQDAEIRSLLTRLNALLAAKKVYDSPAITMTFGLFQGEKLCAGADLIYNQLLKKRLLPVILGDMEQHLAARIREGRTTNYEGLYNLLKVYLMMGMPEKMDARLAGHWARVNWESQYAREPQMQAQLVEHTERLFHSAFDQVGLNQELIAQARLILNATPIAVQIYTQLKGESAPDQALDVRLEEALGSNWAKVFSLTTTSGAGKGALIPGLFTAQGYEQIFKKKGLDYIKKALAQNWILNNSVADKENDLNRLHDDLLKLYFSEYTAQWQNLLDSLVFKKPENINQTIGIIDEISGGQSPLRLLLAALEKNTVLLKNSASAEDQGIKDAAQASAQKLALEVQRHFEPLTSLVASIGGTPPKWDKVVTHLSQVRDFLMQVSTAAKSEEQAFNLAKERMSATGGGDAINIANNEFRLLPEPVKGWLLSLSSLGWDLTLDSAKKELTSTWKADVLAPYSKGLQGRYPLVKTSKIDATVADFSRFFAPNGIMDQFFKAKLSPFVDTSSPNWKLVAMGNSRVGMSQESLKQFRNAARIREALFATGGATPSVSFELKPVSMDDRVATFRISLEGQTAAYSHGPARPEKFTWPGPETSGGVRITFQTVDGKELTQAEEGPWAWMRMLDHAAIENTSLPDRFLLTFQVDGFKARYELQASSVDNPFSLPELANFRCPDSL